MVSTGPRSPVEFWKVSSPEVRDVLLVEVDGPDPIGRAIWLDASHPDRLVVEYIPVRSRPSLVHKRNGGSVVGVQAGPILMPRALEIGHEGEDELEERLLSLDDPPATCPWAVLDDQVVGKVIDITEFSSSDRIP